MTVFVGFFLPAVIALGVWQLGRDVEKRGMEMDYLAQLSGLPSAPDDQALAQRFKRVALQGHFMPEAFLVDNQVAADGSVGYWLVHVFDDVRGRRFLLNRGFVKAPEHRGVLPIVGVPSGDVRVVGTVWPDTGLVPVLGDDHWATDWPKRVQRLDVVRMSALVGAVPVEIRLEPGQPGVINAAPFAQVLSDAKHLGYAVTWFGLGLVLCAGYLLVGVKQARVANNAS